MCVYAYFGECVLLGALGVSFGEAKFKDRALARLKKGLKSKKAVENLGKYINFSLNLYF